MEEVRDLARSPKARESPTMDLPSSVLPSKEGDKGGSTAGHLLPCLPSPHARFPRTATFPRLLRAGCLDILCSWSSLVDFAVFSP